MMMEILASVAIGGFILFLVHILNQMIWKPRLLRFKLLRQGINGPSPHFLLGNIPEIKRLIHSQLQSTAAIETNQKNGFIKHDWPFTVFPYYDQWMKQYGPVFLYSTGNIQFLSIVDIDIVKEISMYTSLDLGKPVYLSKDRGPLLGQGILASSGPIWAHQRKIIAPELYMEKVKGMVNLMVDSTKALLTLWESMIERKGDTAEIRIDQDLRNLSADIISKACFGSNYIHGKEIFTSLRNLQNIMSKTSIGIPGFRYIPSKNNREIWRLEKEINSKILNVVNQRILAAREQDLLQMILDGAKNACENDGLSSNLIMSRDTFIIDNCKNIFFAGYETTAITASWILMLLAAYPDWQTRVRSEVQEICRGGVPDVDMLRSMKTLTMVIQETLRLYSPASFIVRQALQDIKFKNILVPKGMNIQIPISILQQDPELWGSDAHMFNPDRFANGNVGATKYPQAYIPFGIGPHVCAGQNLAMIELKVILSLILSRFSFSLSSSYQHSPAFRLVIEPGNGVVLDMKIIL
uniref:Cytochrome P450 oxidase CYP714J5 n=1 Tax=Polygala tenuifolia TaxID=355332 RepID=A0A3G5AP27_9FABA|nr:cytochrome P450 oxidase CYP714J5 [Polygala tenuifolia]